MLKQMQRDKATCVSLVVAAALVGSVVSATPAGAGGATSTQVIEYEQKLHGAVTQTDPVAIDIPEVCHNAGLAVSITVSDSYDGREDRSPQLSESVVVEVHRRGAVVAEVGPTPDLPDGIRSASIQTTLGSLPEPESGDQLVVRLAEPGESYANSVVVDRVELEPVCTVTETVEVERIVEVEKVVEVEKIVEVEKVVEVERVQDAELAEPLTTCEAGILGVVARMYEAYFDRRPDRAGLLFWSGRLGSGMRLIDASAHFEASDEFRQLNGSLTDDEFVRLIYRNALGREAEPGGLAYWTGQLAEGKSRAWVVNTIAVLPESLRAGCFAE